MVEQQPHDTDVTMEPLVAPVLDPSMTESISGDDPSLPLKEQNHKSFEFM